MSAEVRYRALTLERASLDTKARTVNASFSSETPYERDFGPEVLLHDPNAIDMTRAAAGLPLLFNHDRSAVIGRAENIHLEHRRLVGTLRFSQNSQASEVWRDVEAGILTDISIGYRIEDMALDVASQAWHVSRWLPLEISLVSIPADATVGIGRSLTSPKETRTMKISLNEIREIVKLGHFDATTAESLALDCLARGLSDDEIAKVVLTRAAERSENDPVLPRFGTAGESNENPAVRARLMGEALAARCGGPAPSERARDFMSMRIPAMARSLLEARGVRTHRLSDGEVIGRALTSTSDFPELLTGAGNRILGAAYQSYKGGLKRICRQTTIADFRAKQVLRLGEAPTLEKVNEHGEYTYGSPVETKTSYSLATFGRIFGITRQALVNDDMDAFGQMVAKFGIAAGEREAVQLINLLTSNPLMGDGVALFHANHGNLAASGAAISVTTLGAARKSMRLQTGQDGVTAIDATPAYLIVPAALETVAEQFLATLSPTVSTDVNPFGGRLELVVDPRLDAKSATAWYLAAKPELIDTIEYAHLEGFQGPYIETRQGFEVDGTEIKCRLDFGCGVTDWRGLFKNPGA